jgi:hypothetical protein
MDFKAFHKRYALGKNSIVPQRGAKFNYFTSQLIKKVGTAAQVKTCRTKKVPYCLYSSPTHHFGTCIARPDMVSIRA